MGLKISLVFKKKVFVSLFFIKKKSSSTLCYIPNIKPKKISLKCDLLQADFLLRPPTRGWAWSIWEGDVINGNVSRLSSNCGLQNDLVDALQGHVDLHQLPLVPLVSWLLPHLQERQEADSGCTMRMWGDLCNAAVQGRNCVACSQYVHRLCYFAISISQLCKQERLNVSQSNWKLWGANVSRLHRHWYTIGDCICVVPLFCSWDQSFAGASEGSPLWPRTCGAKTWNSTRHHQQAAAAGTSAGPCVLSHLVKNFWCADIYLKNIHRSMMFCLFGAFFLEGRSQKELYTA